MELTDIKPEVYQTDLVKNNNTVNGDHDVNIEVDRVQIKHSNVNFTEKEASIEGKENTVEKMYGHVTEFVEEHHNYLIILRNMLFLVGFFIYFGFAIAYHVGDEGSWRLIGFTIFGVLLIIWKVLKRTPFHTHWKRGVKSLNAKYQSGKISLIVRWILYVAMTLFMTIYVIVAVAIKTPENLQSLFGIGAFPFLLWLYSNNRRKVNWHTVFWAMSIQFIMALLILKTSWGASIIRWVGDRLTSFVSSAEAGSIFIFGPTYTDHGFAMGAMIQTIPLLVGISVLTYLGVIRFIVDNVGRALAFVLQVTPAEGINSVCNIFLHVPESFMFINEYIPDMTPSQLFVTYAGGMSTVGGTSLIIFMASGVPAAPLVAASAMSAPAALATSKIAFPSHDDEVAPEHVEAEKSAQGLLRKPKSLMDAIVIGINQSVILIVQAIAFIMSFIIIMAFINMTLNWFGDRVGIDNLTIELIFSYVFYPFAFMMGARHEDCLFIGELLGIRTFSLAVVAYPRLGPIILNGISYRDYISESVNNTWVQDGKDIFLEASNTTLVGGIMDPRSEVIATYSLCGSASFAIIGLIIGSFDAIVPHRMQEITQHIFRSMIVGTVASYLTACFAGLLFEETVASL